MIGIYMFENKDNHKKYIGQSVNITKRKWEHIHAPSQSSVFDKILRAIGEDKFIFSAIEQCPVEKLDEREIYWINFYDSVNSGYNIMLGGTDKRGEKNPMVKLTESQVKEIIVLLEQANLNNRQIANKYGVCQNTIDLINRCQIWTYMHNYKTNIRKEALLNKGKKMNYGQGETCPTSKINEGTALEIIRYLRTSSLSCPKIAKLLNCSVDIVYDINRCKTWRYLHDHKHNIRLEYKVNEG